MNESSLKICKRCLLRDLSEADSAKIKTYKNAISEHVSDEEYEFRLSICKSCNLLNVGTCNACGCYVELRAYGKLGKCPHHKW